MASHPPDWELLQSFLGLAYTIQQEKPRGTAQVDALPGYEQHPLERIATFARNLTEATGAAIALGDAQAMVCVARSGTSAPPLGAEFQVSEGLSGECIRLKQPAICVNAAADPRVNYQACRALNIASLLYLPLHSPQGSVMGMLGVFSSQPLHFSQRDISALRPTERLVQEALASTGENADPATLGALLRQAGIDTPPRPEAPEPKDEAPEIEASFMALPEFKVPERRLPQPAATPKPAVIPDRPKERSDAIFVGRVVDDSVADFDQQPNAAPKIAEDEPEGRSRIPVMLIVLLLVLVASAAYKYRREMQRSHAQPKVQETRPVETPVAPAPAAAENSTQNLTDTVSMASAENGAVIDIELPRPIRYEGYQLEHPDRIYFDLHDVRLSDAKGSEFKNAEGLVSGVRLFTYTTGVTRIVFDLRHPANFAAKLDDKPARLTIEIKRIGESSKRPEAETPVDLHTAAN